MGTMLKAKRTVRPATRQRERARLRAEVLRLGEVLGWQPQDIILFTEALTQTAWRRCGIAEFTAVLEEERSLLEAVAAKAAKRLARDQQHAVGEWGTVPTMAGEQVRYADRA